MSNEELRERYGNMDYAMNVANPILVDLVPIF